MIFKALANRVQPTRDQAGRAPEVHGFDAFDKVIDIDQSPIGRTPRSNPATYTGLFDHIRELYAKTPDAKARGYKPGRFSFNVKGGRCETCRGDGTIKIEMHFLPDVYINCEVCHGRRYNRETLEVRFKGKSIADVLDMPIEEALEFFAKIPKIQAPAADPARRGPRLHAARPAGDDALRRRGAAGEAGDGARRRSPPGARCTSSTSRRPACTSTTSPSCWSGAAAAGGRRQHGGRDRAQPGRDQAGRLGARPGPGGRRPRRRGGRAGTPEEVAETPGSHTGEFLRRVLPVYEAEQTLVA